MKKYYMFLLHTLLMGVVVFILGTLYIYLKDDVEMPFRHAVRIAMNNPYVLAASFIAALCNGIVAFLILKSESWRK